MRTSFISLTFLIVFLPLFLMLGCGSSGGGETGDDIRAYEIRAARIQVAESEQGLFATLSNVDGELRYTVSNSIGEEFRMGSIDSSDFARWLIHPAAAKHDFLLFETLEITSESGTSRYRIALPLNFTFEEDSSSYTIQIELQSQPRPSSKTLKVAASSATAKIITSSPAHPSECATTLPPAIPGLEFKLANNYTQIWNDEGSGNYIDVSVYRPVLGDGFQSLGDLAMPNYKSPPSNGCYSLLVKPVPASGVDSSSYLAHPIGYQQVWTGRGSGSRMDGSFWRPTPPSGYTCTGDLAQGSGPQTLPNCPGTPAQDGFSAPSTDTMVCVKSELLAPATFSIKIWDDRTSGADTDVSLYAVDGLYTFRSQNNYEPPRADLGSWTFKAPN